MNEIRIDIIYNGTHDKSGINICNTCRDSMIGGKIPSMAIVNELQLTEIREVTELENNLIALNLNFQ